MDLDLEHPGVLGEIPLQAAIMRIRSPLRDIEAASVDRHRTVTVRPPHRPSPGARSLVDPPLLGHGKAGLRRAEETQRGPTKCATRDLLRSFGWGIAALHRLDPSDEVASSRRPPHSIF